MNTTYNRNLTVLVLAMILLSSLSSCEDFFETTLELDPPEFKSQLVLSAVLNSNETLREVALTHTVGLNSDPLKAYVEDADIELTYPDGTAYIFDHLGASTQVISYNYILGCPEFTQEGTYKIKATSRGREVSAEVELPKKAIIQSVKYEEDGGVGEFGDDYAAIDIIIEDESGAANYYKIGLFGVTPQRESSIRLISADPSIQESRNYLNVIVSDAQFDGEDYRLRVLFRTYEDEQAESFKLIFSSISKDQYRFDRLLVSHSENEDNPFTSPVQLHTNIDGGLGIFAIENVSEIDVPK